MTDRIPSDHDAVDTHRATVERVGRTDRRRVAIPDAVAETVSPEEVVRLDFDGDTFRARVETDVEGNPVFSGAYDSPSLARDPGDGTNHLADWLGSTDVAVGDSVLLDVVTDGFKFGLRAPGERAVYDATEPPSESLASIARDLEE